MQHGTCRPELSTIGLDFETVSCLPQFRDHSHSKKQHQVASLQTIQAKFHIHYHLLTDPRAVDMHDRHFSSLHRTPHPQGSPARSEHRDELLICWEHEHARHISLMLLYDIVPQFDLQSSGEILNDTPSESWDSCVLGSDLSGSGGRLR